MTTELPPAASDRKKDRWKQKAMAFVTRSHRHLWGKNNEAPLAYLFERGLKNDFAKQMLLGWNKFGQNRPGENWGLDKDLFLPAGIVVPYIIDQTLVAVCIHPFEHPGPTTLLPGSRTSSMVIGSDTDPAVIVPNLLDGLYLAQETALPIRLVISLSAEAEPAEPERYILLSNPKGSEPETPPDDPAGFEKRFYQTKEEMLTLIDGIF